MKKNIFSRAVAGQWVSGDSYNFSGKFLGPKPIGFGRWVFCVLDEFL